MGWLFHYGTMGAIVFFTTFSILQVPLDPESSSHHEASHLMDEAQDALHLFELEQRQWITEILQDIATETTVLETYTEKLKELVEVREARKQDRLLWFLDGKLQLAVDEVQLEINDQQRLVDNTLDDIRLQWKRLKPIYGLQSRMFLSEALTSIVRVVLDAMTFWIPSVAGLTFSLASALFVGPFALLIIAAWLAIGATLLPYTMAVLAVVWAVRFPLVIAQYQPSTREFVIVYAASLSVVMLVVAGVHHVFNRGVSGGPRNRSHLD